MAKIADLEQIVLIPDGLGPYGNVIYDQMREQGMGAVYLGKISAADVAAGRVYAGEGVCEPAAGLIGQFARYFDKHGFARNTAVIVPDICLGCDRVDMAALVKGLLARLGAENVELMTVTNFELAQSAVRVGDLVKRAEAEAEAESTVGICGSPAVHAMNSFRKETAKSLGALGYKTEVPPLTCIFGKEDPLGESVAYFEERGIRKVVCILPDGCQLDSAFSAESEEGIKSRYESMDFLFIPESLGQVRVQEELEGFAPALA